MKGGYAGSQLRAMGGGVVAIVPHAPGARPAKRTDQAGNKHRAARAGGKAVEFVSGRLHRSGFESRRPLAKECGPGR